MRSHYDLMLCAKVMRTIGFFKQNKTKDIELQEVIAALQIEEIKEKTKLINYNDTGDKFYVLLAG